MSKGVQIGNKTRAFVNFLNIQFALDIINVHESKPKKKKKRRRRNIQLKVLAKIFFIIRTV